MISSKQVVFDKDVEVSYHNNSYTIHPFDGYDLREVDTIIIKKESIIDFCIQKAFPNLKTLILESIDSIMTTDLKMVNTIYLDFNDYLPRDIQSWLAARTENFEVSDNNSRYSTIDGVLYSKDKKTLIKCPRRKSGRLVINEGTEVIKENSCSYLDIFDIVLPGSLTKIEEEGFSHNYNLKKIDFGDSNINYIPKCAFERCTSLETVIIPDSVHVIGDYAFFGCTNLADVHLPCNLERIGNYVFWNCKELQKINIPDQIEYYGRLCFAPANILIAKRLSEGIVNSFAITENQNNKHIQQSDRNVVELNYNNENFFFPRYMKASIVEFLDGCINNLPSNLYTKGASKIVRQDTAVALYTYSHDQGVEQYIRNNINEIIARLARTYKEEQLITVLKLNLHNPQALKGIYQNVKSELSTISNAYFLQAINAVNDYNQFSL